MNLDYMIKNLIEWSPRMAEIMQELGDDLVSDVEIGIPINGGRPYFGVKVNGCIFAPAEPRMRALFQEMDDILWSRARKECEQAMHDVQRMKDFYGYIFIPEEEHGGGTGDLIDVDAVEVGSTPALGSGGE